MTSGGVRALMAGWALIVGAAGAALGQSLDHQVETLLADPKLGGARTGVVMIDLDSGEVLAQHAAEDSFIPASNMKLLTSGAALVLLGKDFAFRTELVYQPEAGGAEGGSARGRVILRGAGDPALGDPKLLAEMKLTVEGLLDSWVKALKDASISPGAELVVDDRVFDRQYVHPTWPVSQLNRWYCAEVAGLNFHANILSIFTEPQEAGRPPAIKTEPMAPWLEIKNKARSVKQGNHTAWVAREAGVTGNLFTLHGDVRWSTDPVEVALSDNPMFTGQLLAARMTAAGIGPSRVRLADADEPGLGTGRVLHVVRTDLPTAMRRCNVDSYNLYAECLLKRMGHDVTTQPGSWSNGPAVMRMALQDRLGAAAGAAITVADGSGMSRSNRVTPRMLANWLVSLYKDSATRDEFVASLPQAGEEGTLKRRFQGTSLKSDVRAKTGYLTGVSAISGYITSTETGRKLVFSIITNDKPNKVALSTIRALEEKIVLLGDAWVSGAKDRAPGGR